MSTEFQGKCLRCRTDCVPISNMSSDEKPEGFICVGYNKQADREFIQDRFTVCWKNEFIDERSHWDKRDIISTVSVLSHALMVDENVMLNEGLTENEMRLADMVE